MGKSFAVVAMGLGAGFITWGLCAQVFGDPVRSPFDMGNFISSASEAIGWGAGFMVAGIMSLLTGCCKGSRSGK